MFVVVSILTILAYVRMKRHVSVYIILYGFSVFSFSLAIDGNFHSLWDYMYVYDDVENSVEIILYWMILYGSYFLFFCLLSNRPSKFKFSKIKPKKLSFLAYSLALLSLFAAFYNYYGAGDISTMLTNPRAWEARFGRKVITNYIFFLHLPALVLFGILLGAGKGTKKDMVIVGLLLLSSGLHGIKFTVLHAFLFYSFSFLVVRGERFTGQVYIIFMILLAFILGFFVFVRGGGVIGFFDYIVSASVNSMYTINNFEFYDISSYKVLNPLSFVPFDRLESRLIEGRMFDHSLNSGFYLNDKYNLQHALTKVGFAFGSGFVIYTAIFAMAINFLRRSSGVEFHKIYFLVMIMSSLLLLFTAFDFYKTKLWFGFFVIFLVYILYATKFNFDPSKK